MNNAKLLDLHIYIEPWVDWITENCIGDRKQIELEEFKQVVSGWLFDYHNTIMVWM